MSRSGLVSVLVGVGGLAEFVLEGVLFEMEFFEGLAEFLAQLMP